MRICTARKILHNLFSFIYHLELIYGVRVNLMAQQFFVDFTYSNLLFFIILYKEKLN
jgi:hypothetical protein